MGWDSKRSARLMLEFGQSGPPMLGSSLLRLMLATHCCKAVNALLVQDVSTGARVRMSRSVCSMSAGRAQQETVMHVHTEGRGGTSFSAVNDLLPHDHNKLR